MIKFIIDQGEEEKIVKWVKLDKTAQGNVCIKVDGKIIGFFDTEDKTLSIDEVHLKSVGLSLYQY